MQGKHTLEIEAAKDGTEKDSNRLSTLFTGNKVYTVITVAGLLILIVSIVLAIVLAPKKTVRTYYISTEDVHWDYTPLAHDACTGKAFAYPANKFTSRRYGNTSGFDNRVGTKYWKARFVEYTDASFTVRSNRSSDWSHLGLVGPVIRAETGDQIRVVFEMALGFRSQ